MIDNSVMMERVASVAVGQKRFFPADARHTPSPQRFMTFAPNTKWGDGQKATDLIWTNEPDFRDGPSVGQYGVARRGLSNFPNIEIEFAGNPNWALDYYRYSGSMSFLSKRLLDLIVEFDPEALDWVRAIGVDVPGIGEYFAVMPRRVIMSVDPLATDVFVERQKVHDDRVIVKIEYGGDFYTIGEIEDSVKLFADDVAPYWLVDAGVVAAAVRIGVRGIHATPTGSSVLGVVSI